MKKVFLLAIIILLSATSCWDKGPDQISFSLKNLTKLIGRSGGYIEKASPGEIFANEDQYLAFKIYDEISGINVAMIYYGLENDKSQFIQVTTEEVNNLTISEKLITFSDNELGTATAYYLAYNNANDELQETSFETDAAMWSFISSNSLTYTDIKDIQGVYFYGDFYILAGGYYRKEGTYEYFFPLLQIGLQNGLVLNHDSGTIAKMGFSHFNRDRLIK